MLTPTATLYALGGLAVLILVVRNLMTGKALWREYTIDRNQYPIVYKAIITFEILVGAGLIIHAIGMMD